MQDRHRICMYRINKEGCSVIISIYHIALMTHLSKGWPGFWPCALTPQHISITSIRARTSAKSYHYSNYENMIRCVSHTIILRKATSKGPKHILHMTIHSLVTNCTQFLHHLSAYCTRMSKYGVSDIHLGGTEPMHNRARTQYRTSLNINLSTRLYPLSLTFPKSQLKPGPLSPVTRVGGLDLVESWMS